MFAVPLELRRILFTPKEIQIATLEYCRINGRRMPQTPVVDLAIQEDVDATVILRFAPSPRMPEPGELAIGRDTAIQVLIRYCDTLRIPLPRAGKKALVHFDGSLALAIELHVETDAEGRERHAVF